MGIEAFDESAVTFGFPVQPRASASRASVSVSARWAARTGR
nr:hypothetical protein [Mycolicibacterium celeriflavum]